MAGTGFEPVGFLGNRQFTGALSKYWIATGATLKIRYGQPVVMTEPGTIIALETSPVAASFCVGIFLGCSYIDSAGNRQFSQSWPAGQSSLGAYAFVADDPTTIFRAKILSSGADDNTKTIDIIGTNCAVDFTNLELATSSGRSSMGVTGFAATTSLAFRVVGLTNDNVSVATTEPNPNFISTTATTYSHALVTWNFGIHFYQQTTGMAA